MYRLLFTTKDNLHQLTVITDGIDSQLNVFVTENTVGDVDYFESLGIVIRAGLTYNIGQFKEWAMNNILRLIAYPEEYEGKEQILVDIVEEMRYFLIPQDKTMAFPKEGDSTYGIGNITRMSPAFYNTFDEIDTAVYGLRRVIELLRLAV